MPKNLSSYALYLLITVLILALYLGDFTGLQKVQWKLDDLMYAFQGEQTSASDIVLISIDETSCSALGDWPWSYDRLADLVATCNSAKPRSILINLDLFSQASEDTSGNTRILANQVSWAENIVLTYDIALAEYSHQRMSRPEYLYQNAIRVESDLGLLDEDAALNVRRAFLPSGIIVQYADGLGFTYMEYDKDRYIRWAPLLANYDGYYYPSAALLTAAIHLGYGAGDIRVDGNDGIRVDKYHIPTDRSARLFISYSEPGTGFTEYTALDLLREQVNLENLQDKLIIIGLTGDISNESFRTPVSPAMSRTELLANTIENIVHSNYITRLDLSLGWNLLILFGFGLFCAVFLPRVTLVYRMIILFVCLFILANLSFVLFNSYRMLVNSLYLGLEILIFMLVSPLLEGPRARRGEKLDLGKFFVRRSREKTFDMESPSVLDNVPIGNGQGDTGRKPDLRETEVLETGLPPVSPAVSEDGPAPRAVQETAVMDASPTPYPAAAAGSPEPAAMDPPIIPEKRPAAIDFSASPRPGDPESIRNLGRYQVVEVLGKGAMGTVFKGIDPAIDRPVALKTIRLDFVADEAELDELRDRLNREACAAGKLSHPNIVTIYDIGAENDLHYIAMEYLQGQTLENLIKRKVQFSYKIIATIITQICAALQYAHDQGIVHRDIKPANIMVLPDYSVKVMDFGIARVDSSSMTRTGVAMGTPNYIAPELLQGKAVDRRCDIFSLGVVMYELLTGRRPFRGENLTSLIFSIINDEPPAPSAVNENVPLIFDHVVCKALKKDPLERYQKASDIKAAVADFIGSFDGARKVGL